MNEWNKEARRNEGTKEEREAVTNERQLGTSDFGHGPQADSAADIGGCSMRKPGRNGAGLTACKVGNLPSFCHSTRR